MKNKMNKKKKNEINKFKKKRNNFLGTWILVRDLKKNWNYLSNAKI